MARIQNNQVVAIEAVEDRLMMSASVVPHLAKITPAKPAPHATVVKLVDPTLTSKSITYKSFAGNPLFAPSGPSLNDISQGDLGDCYLLSTLSSIAKTDASLIEQDVVENSNGTFSVTFGKSAPITVNADLPVFHDGQLAYAQFGADNSIWVPVVEKAYAEFKNPKANSYATINGGWMGDVFTAFGITAQSSFYASTAQSLLTTLAADLQANDFTTFGTEAKLPKSSPLIAGHAYEVNAVNDDANGNPVSVTFRNPWGNDLASGGYVTVTAAQAFSAFGGMAIGLA